MRLLTLSNVEKGMPDAFIKLEDIYFSTIGFPKNDGEYMWLIDNKTGKFNRCHAYFKNNALPRLAGIFKIIDNTAQLHWFFSDINEVKSAFKKITGYNISDTIIKEAPVEATPIIEEAPTYTPPEKAPDTFWDCNADSYNNILNSNPENIELSELIPGSKWATVADENYVFGIIYDDINMPLYLCYAFPLPWSDTPPESLEGYCQWIPVDFTKPHDNGYWVIYINAKTGERVK